MFENLFPCSFQNKKLDLRSFREKSQKIRETERFPDVGVSLAFCYQRLFVKVSRGIISPLFLFFRHSLPLSMYIHPICIYYISIVIDNAASWRGPFVSSEYGFSFQFHTFVAFMNPVIMFLATAYIGICVWWQKDYA